MHKHVDLFFVWYQHRHWLTLMRIGPKAIKHPIKGLDTRRGLIALLHLWARALAHGHHFAVKVLDMRYRAGHWHIWRVWVKQVAWHHHRHTFGFFVRKYLLTKVTARS